MSSRICLTHCLSCELLFQLGSKQPYALESYFFIFIIVLLNQKAEEFGMPYSVAERQVLFITASGHGPVRIKTLKNQLSETKRLEIFLVNRVSLREREI